MCSENFPLCCAFVGNLVLCFVCGSIFCVKHIVRTFLYVMDVVRTLPVVCVCGKNVPWIIINPSFKFSVQYSGLDAVRSLHDLCDFVFSGA